MTSDNKRNSKETSSVVADRKKTTPEVASKLTPSQTVAEKVMGIPGLANIIAQGGGLTAASNLVTVNKTTEKSLKKEVKASREEMINDIESWMAAGTLVENCCQDVTCARLVLQTPKEFGIGLVNFVRIASSHPSLDDLLIRAGEFFLWRQGPNKEVLSALCSPENFNAALNNPKQKKLLEKYFSKAIGEGLFAKKDTEFTGSLNELLLLNFYTKWRDSFQDFPKVMEFIFSRGLLDDNLLRKLAHEDENVAIYCLKHRPSLFTSEWDFKSTWDVRSAGAPIDQLGPLFQQNPDLIDWAVTEPKVCNSIPWWKLMGYPKVVDIALNFAESGKNPFNLWISHWVQVAVARPELAERIIPAFPYQFNKDQLNRITREALAKGIDLSQVIKEYQTPEEKKKVGSWFNFFRKHNEPKVGATRSALPDSTLNEVIPSNTSSSLSGRGAEAIRKENLADRRSETEGGVGLSETTLLPPGSGDEAKSKNLSEAPKDDLTSFLEKLEDRSDLKPRLKKYISDLKKTVPLESHDPQIISDWITKVTEDMEKQKDAKKLRPTETSALLEFLTEFQKHHFSVAMPNPR